MNSNWKLYKALGSLRLEKWKIIIKPPKNWTGKSLCQVTSVKSKNMFLKASYCKGKSIQFFRIWWGSSHSYGRYSGNQDQHWTRALGTCWVSHLVNLLPAPLLPPGLEKSSLHVDQPDFWFTTAGLKCGLHTAERSHWVSLVQSPSALLTLFFLQASKTFSPITTQLMAVLPNVLRRQEHSEKSSRKHLPPQVPV